MVTEVLKEQEENVESVAPRVELKVIAQSTTGYAAIQNNIPVVHSLLVKNNSDEVLNCLDVLVSCAPAFAQGARFHFEQLAPRETRTISPVDLLPDHTYLIKLDEAEKASIRVKAVTEGATFADINYPIEVLAYDQWAGTHVNGTARIQTVSSVTNRNLHELLIAFKARTGYGVLCNTSLNFKGRGFINNIADLSAYAVKHNLDGFVVEGRTYLLKSSRNYQAYLRTANSMAADLRMDSLSVS